MKYQKHMEINILLVFDFAYHVYVWEYNMFLLDVFKNNACTRIFF